MNESASVEVDWKTLILECGWLERLERLSRKRFGEGGLAEEASTYVIDKLSQDNWQMLGAFRGQSKPVTYLHTLSSNLIEEFSRKRFGRPRPPEWLKREGNFWVKVWKLLCLERRMPESIIDLLCGDDIHGVDNVKQVMRTIKAKLPSCGESVREVTLDSNSNGDDGDDLQDQIPEFNTPDSNLEQSQLQELMEVLSLLLAADNGALAIERANDAGRSIVGETNLATNKTFHQYLDLTDIEWVVLRMAFQDGINFKMIAQTLGLKPHEPGRIKNRILEKIRQALVSSNIDLDTIKSLL